MAPPRSSPTSPAIATRCVTASRVCCRPICAPSHATSHDCSAIAAPATACGPLASHERVSSRGKRPPPAPSPRWPAKRGGRPEARADGDRDRIERGADSLAWPRTAPGPRARRLRPPAPHPPRHGRRGHQDLPLPRSQPSAREGALPVGFGHRPRHGDPPDPRLPVPDGAVLLVDGAARSAGLGRAAHLARHDPVRRGSRSPLPHADHGLARHGAPALAAWSSPLRPTCSPPTSSTTPPASR